jgi:hypothetical protein
VIFHSYVKLPEGIPLNPILNPIQMKRDVDCHRAEAGTGRGGSLRWSGSWIYGVAGLGIAVL